jgi:hypothetical protein
MRDEGEINKLFFIQVFSHVITVSKFISQTRIVKKVILTPV